MKSKAEKSRLLPLFLAAVMLLSLLPWVTPTASAAGGTGTPDTSWYGQSRQYYISTADELAGLAALVNDGNDFENKTVTLTGDLDLSAYGADYDNGRGWTPIGTYANQFKGTFDGGGHVITGLAINRTTMNYSGYEDAGLFGLVGSGGVVKDIGILGGSVSGTGSDRLGGVAGWNKGTITGCYNTGKVNAPGNVGGIVGVNDGATIDCWNGGAVDAMSCAGGIVGYNGGAISGCYNTGELSGISNLGGIAGTNNNTITGCYNAGDISVTGDLTGNCVGGVLGYNNFWGTVTDCYNVGDVNIIGNYVGGVVGFNHSIDAITGCYNAGEVSGGSCVGGVVGRDDGAGIVAGCYYDTDKYGGAGIGDGDSSGVTGLTTAEMTHADALTDYMSALGSGIWYKRAEDDDFCYYPELIAFAVSPASAEAQEASQESVKAWKAAKPWNNLFTDVHEGDWFYGDVEYVYENGLMAGTSTTTFEPQTAVSRAMVVTVLWRLAGEPEATGANPFTDLTQDWYKEACIWAAENDIARGYGDGTFGPNDSVTREQLATMLCRYTGWAGLDVSASADLSVYADENDISDWALAAMQWANAEGLITGRSAAALAPAGTATRAELAAILYRFTENVIG